MWLPQAVSETFKELFTLSDPNSAGNKAPKHKVKRVIRKYLQLTGTVPRREEQKTIVQVCPRRGKTPTSTTATNPCDRPSGEHEKVAWPYSRT